MTNIEVTPASIHELDHIDHIQRKAFIEDLWEPKTLFQSIIQAGGGFCFTARKGSDYAGYLLAYPTCKNRDDFEQGPVHQAHNHDCVYLHDLCVSPDFRGMKVAQHLLKELETHCKKSAFSEIIGISVQDSAGFWQKQGFIIGDHCSYHGEAAAKIHKELS